MSAAIEPAEAKGLSRREYELLARLHQVCIWMAQRPNRVAVLKQIAEEYACTAQVAENWLAKAEDFMALGVLETASSAREIYTFRLQELYALARSNIIRDQVEITTKPTKIIETSGKRVVVDAQHTKVKPKAFDPAAMGMAFKLAKELAILTGGRAADRRGARVDQMNIQINHGELPTAQVTDSLSNEQLAQMIGAEVVADEESIVILPEGDVQGEGQGPAAAHAGGGEEPGSVEEPHAGSAEPTEPGAG